MITNVSLVLTRLMKERKLTSAELARQTNIAQPVIYRMAVGDTDNPKIATLIPIAAYFGISIDQLIGIEPLPLSISASSDAQLIKKPSLTTIPLISWQDIIQWGDCDKIQINAYITTDMHVGSRGFALRVTDSSLRPHFIEKTLLTFDPDATVQSGDFILATLNHSKEIIFKQLLIDGKDRYLKPLNPELRTIFIEHPAELNIIGSLVEAKCQFKE